MQGRLLEMGLRVEKEREPGIYECLIHGMTQETYHPMNAKSCT